METKAVGIHICLTGADSSVEADDLGNSCVFELLGDCFARIIAV